METRTREAELLAAFRQHFDDEIAGDVEKTLAACTDDIVYEHPFRLGIMRGKDAVRRYYEETWAVRPFESLEIVRHWMPSDDTIIVEVDSRLGPPGAVEHVRTVCVGVFRDGKLAHEIVYTGTSLPN